MPASCPCGRLAVFWGFHMGPLACPSRRASSVRLYSTRCPVMSSLIAPLIGSPYGSSSSLAPSSDTIGGEGCLLGLAVPFMSARRDIIRHHLPSNCLSPRLLTPPPHTRQSRERLRLSALTAGIAAAAPICSTINPPIRSAPIRPAQSTRETGRTTGRAYPRARCDHPVCLPLQLRGSRGRRRQLRFSSECF